MYVHEALEEPVTRSLFLVSKQNQSELEYVTNLLEVKNDIGIDFN